MLGVMEIVLNLTDTVDPIAIYAAIVATTVLAWDVWKWLREGPRLRVFANPGYKTIGIPTVDPDATWVMVKVTNVGTSPTTINMVGGAMYNNWIKRLLRKPSEQFFVATPVLAGMPKLPHVLDPGNEWTGLINQDDEFESMARQGLLYVGLYHSVGNRPIWRRLIIPPSSDG